MSLDVANLRLKGLKTYHHDANVVTMQTLGQLKARYPDLNHPMVINEEDFLTCNRAPYHIVIDDPTRIRRTRFTLARAAHHAKTFFFITESLARL